MLDCTCVFNRYMLAQLPEGDHFHENTKKCSHEKFALDVYCVCPSAKETFEKRVATHDREIPSDAVLTQNIEKSHDFTYGISIRLQMDESEGDSVGEREISHLEMCKYAGIRKLGDMITQTFECGCEMKIPEHCGRGDGAVFLKIREKNRDKILQTYPHSFCLHCGSSRQQQSDLGAQVIKQNDTKKMRFFLFRGQQHFLMGPQQET